MTEEEHNEWVKAFTDIEESIENVYNAEEKTKRKKNGSRLSELRQTMKPQRWEHTKQIQTARRRPLMPVSS